MPRLPIFWHATGFGRLPNEPEKAEYFGMTTLEAMSYGAVPMVFPDAGQLEIVTTDTGVFWSTEAELAQLTEQLIQNGDRRSRLAQNAAAASRSFDADHFRASACRVFR